MRSGPPDGRSRPEILAPAGDPLALRAALAAGADAVYLGMARFNARGRADRFRDVTLRASIDTAHAHGARVHITLNTLLHDDELPIALDLAEEARDAGADAVIVQDLALAARLRDELPELPVHASTQMSVHQSVQARALVERLGLRRVILARECSVEETGEIAERLRPLGADVEVFVHGALCYAYSGQCLMSNFAGRRSANRGICAQNCRFDFSSSEPEETRSSFRPLPVFERRAANQLLSMKDLAAFPSIAALADAGVASFKIEGRLKGPEYVAEVVRLYRAALDAWESRREFLNESAERAAGRVYSRGFTNGYLDGELHPTSMRGDKRQLEGEPDLLVENATRKDGRISVVVRDGHRVVAGQGYRYAHDRYRGGFRVIHVEAGADGSQSLRVRFGSDASGRRHRRGARGRERPPPPLPVGLACYLNDDPELGRRIESLVASVRIEVAAVRLALTVRGQIGEPLVLLARAADGRSAEVRSAVPLEKAHARELDQEVLTAHLGRLGGTAYALGTLDASGLAKSAFLGFPALHATRRALVAALDASPATDASRASAPRVPIRDPSIEEVPARATSLRVMVSTSAAIDAALDAGADGVVIEARDLSDPALLDRARELAGSHPRRVSVRLPPVVHDAREDEARVRVIAERLPQAALIAGHAGQIHLAIASGRTVDADLHLNASSAASAKVLTELGIRTVTLSLELDAKECARIAGRSGDERVEVVVGGRVFSMLTRQTHALEDREAFSAVSEHGHAYVFERADEMTTLWEARELVGAAVLGELVGRVDSVRLDLPHQDANAVLAITGAHRAAIDALLASRPDASERCREAERIHREHARHGSFTGHLVRGARALDS